MNLATTITTIVLATATTSGLADLPNAHSWPMEHIMVSMDGTDLYAHVNTDASNPIEMFRFAGESYDGNAAALNDQYYSDQYGWILDGIVDPGAGNSIWIEMTSQTAGLETYEGGMRMMIPMQTFDPIFGTAGSAMNWQWNGMMTHNWYAADSLGDYEANYRIYVGDAAGNAVSGFGEASVTLNLRAVPAPGALSILGLGSLVATRRRRA
ncbi:MAG: PEP-CTERM sorting domain-containing protein [Phycisphaerales bacterium]